MENSSTSQSNDLSHLTPEQAEAIRQNVMALSDRLSTAEVHERVSYGFLLVIFIIGWVWDIAKLSDLAYYVIKFILDVTLAGGAVFTYIQACERADLEKDYWEAVSSAYHD